jgi:flagellar motor protein MotB
MINAIRYSRRPLWMILAFVVALSFSSCKSKKKAMEAQAAEKAKQEQEAALRKQQEDEAAKRQREADEKAKADADAAAKTSTPYAKLGQYFDSITKSSSITSANSSISEALTMFASPDTPVLIVISDSNGQKDYDRPTTIIDYLNYLKDQKKNMNKIEKLQFDNSGKITEVELRKNN